MLTAVQQDALALKFAPEELQNDREFVLAAVEQNYRALQSRALQYASEVLSGTTTRSRVVLAAVRMDDSMLEYASKELQNDRRVLLAVLGH